MNRSEFEEKLRDLVGTYFSEHPDEHIYILKELQLHGLSLLHFCELMEKKK